MRIIESFLIQHPKYLKLMYIFSNGSFLQLDINECRVRNGGCRSGQVCVNVPGHFKCMCQPGTRFDNNTATCVSTGELLV